MSDELANLIAQKFIQRRNVKAIQFNNGEYSPDNKLKNLGQYAPLGIKRTHLLDHLAGKHTYGHYLIDDNNLARVFAIDIDLASSGFYVPIPSYQQLEGISNEDFDNLTTPIECNPLELWKDRSAKQARAWFKLQMKILAIKFCKTIQETLDIPTVAAYSGNKGIHVYGFTGEMSSEEVRYGVELVIEVLDEFNPLRGKNFFSHKNNDPVHGFQNFEFEIYPKQANLEGKHLGNLLRLPLGRNKKSNDPTFFLDLTTPLGEFTPHKDPVKLLTEGNPFV